MTSLTFAPLLFEPNTYAALAFDVWNLSLLERSHKYHPKSSLLVSRCRSICRTGYCVTHTYFIRGIIKLATRLCRLWWLVPVVGHEWSSDTPMLNLLGDSGEVRGPSHPALWCAHPAPAVFRTFMSGHILAQDGSIIQPDTAHLCWSDQTNAIALSSQAHALLASLSSACPSWSRTSSNVGKSDMRPQVWSLVCSGRPQRVPALHGAAAARQSRVSALSRGVPCRNTPRRQPWAARPHSSRGCAGHRGAERWLAGCHFSGAATQTHPYLIPSAHSLWAFSKAVLINCYTSCKTAVSQHFSLLQGALRQWRIKLHVSSCSWWEKKYIYTLEGVMAWLDAARVPTRPACEHVCHESRDITMSRTHRRWRTAHAMKFPRFKSKGRSGSSEAPCAPPAHAIVSEKCKKTPSRNEQGYRYAGAKEGGVGRTAGGRGWEGERRLAGAERSPGTHVAECCAGGRRGSALTGAAHLGARLPCDLLQPLQSWVQVGPCLWLFLFHCLSSLPSLACPFEGRLEVLLSVTAALQAVRLLCLALAHANAHSPYLALPIGTQLA